jgi:ribokinase
MRAHDVARRDVCRWIARCHGLAGAIDAGLLGRHQQQLLRPKKRTMRNRVVVVGSANQDLTSYTARLPSLGETVLGSSFTTSCGGKGANQACAAAAVGGGNVVVVSMICRVGHDVFGQAVLANFLEKGIEVVGGAQEAVVQSAGVSTGVASIVVDSSSGENMIVVTPGANHALTAGNVQAAFKSFLLNDVAIVVVQLEILPEAALAALKTGRELGAMTILNTAPAPDTFKIEDFYTYTDVVVANETELRQICGCDVGRVHSGEEEKLAKGLLLDKGIGKGVVVTLGARGAMVVALNDTDGAQTTFVNAPPDLPCRDEPVQDTVGAGDAFCGALATYLSVGMELERAATLACGFASMSVRLRGASYPTAEKLPVCLQIEKVVAAS